MLKVCVVGLASLVACATLGACATSPSRSGFEEGPGGSGNGTDAGGSSDNPGATGNFGSDTSPTTPTPPNEVHEVYGHSGDVLFRLDPLTKAVTQVGKFDGCSAILDIAINEASILYAVSLHELFRVDTATAKCTSIAKGLYPNSLSFVPKGTVDATAEALVGYESGDYLRIDPKTGATKKIGSLGGGLTSSGDIVSVKGGKTYLTVKGTKACTKNDCLVEVNPTTGMLVHNWGSVEHNNVFGISFWGGSVYGFDDQGNLFEVKFGTKSITTSEIAIPEKPAGLSFWGAGSSTSAPLVSTPR
jgi:hypothetical protein